MNAVTIKAAKEQITFYEDFIGKLEKDKQEHLAARRRWYQLLEVKDEEKKNSQDASKYAGFRFWY